MGRIREGIRKVNKNSGRKMKKIMFRGELVGDEREGVQRKCVPD